MVEMVDGSVIAQLGVTDMKHPIQYALTYPHRQKGCLEPLNIAKLNNLTFEEPDLDRFPCLALAYRALRTGGTMPAVLNAANEVAVRAFLDGKIRLIDIAAVNESVMDEHETAAADSLETILAADEWARGRAIMRVENQAAAA
jgi:1-deoxy-D-xylulose-5-phosphate reductoisomerase